MLETIANLSVRAHEHFNRTQKFTVKAVLMPKQASQRLRYPPCYGERTVGAFGCIQELVAFGCHRLGQDRNSGFGDVGDLGQFRPRLNTAKFVCFGANTRH
jgi:hypothetical protein